MKQTKTQLILKFILVTYLIVGLLAIWFYSRNSVSLLSATADESQEEIDIVERQGTGLFTDDADDVIIDESTEELATETFDESTEELVADTFDESTEELAADTIDETAKQSEADDIAEGSSEDSEEETADDTALSEDSSSDEESALALNTENYIGEASVSKKVKRLNMRKGPGKSYKVIKEFSRDEVLYLIEEDSKNSGWSHVTDGTVEGYMSTQYLEITLY